MASILNVDQINNAAGTGGLTIDSSGQVLLPAIPFMKMDVGSDTNVTGSSSGVPTPFKNVLSSRGITLNTSTYKFQVPVTGLYHFSGSVRISLTTTADYIWWTVADTSGTRLQNNGFVLGNYRAPIGQFSTASGSMLHPLTASTDYEIQFASSFNGTYVVHGPQTWMDIFLVGGS